MARVRVFGAGECGLPLARRLLDGGVPVTLVADRTAEQVLNGSVTSTQVKFPRTLDLETAAGMGTWRETAPQILGIRFHLAVDAALVTTWTAPFSRPAQSVDQRTALSHRMTEFVSAGGDLRITELSAAEADRHSGDYDLTVVTRASKDLAACFPADAARPMPDRPMRRLLAVYLDGVAPDPDGMGAYVALPGLGEAVTTPCLVGAPGHERRADNVMFAALPGGELDVFDEARTPAARLDLIRALIVKYLPPELADRFRDVDLTDAGATLAGGVTPAVREPVGVLPSGAAVLGGADVVCRMDPGGAQGANNAVHCGFRYAEAILATPEGPFDREWMRATAQPWLTEIAHPAAEWTISMLDPSPRMQELLLTAAQNPALAAAFAETFVHPATMSDLVAGQVS
ncbi:hypothetical protein ABIA39_008079 [Nocardia sp. GAS34]|uniref:styrene monooxygenase/indole monooxygenase family protein n=1 Tax=unclassified Nocardia TaxID=2637762 RepID=UPI003D260273